ncbi:MULTISPECIES: M14-type cytosolic carboxypeptidase [unclassified Roseitalea]|uniref:M14 family metallopeptidase n=1 Tax=unclassified Roseitalea TaxID=2639107 RepID=UPI00273DACAD|nr:MULTISPECIES: M14-type cytosolic carboxypeptidase [unclassified Roseitalea]
MPSTAVTSTVTVSAGFEAGSIRVLRAHAPDSIRVRLSGDPTAGDLQWFYFRVSGLAGRGCRIEFDNADAVARLDGREDVPDCWTGYRPFCSRDAQTWFRCDAHYQNGVLTIIGPEAADTLWFAYYPPYPMQRHAALIGRAVADPRVRLDTLGTTPDGHEIDLLRIGTPAPGKPKVWLMGRQHPSETMAGFFMEGLLARLLDPADALGRHLVDTLDLHVIPTVNPDGSRRGHTRTNARAMNLNRAWADPDPATALEVVLIRDRMRAEGVDFCLDVHGDEELPYVFLGGPLEIPSRSERLSRLFDDYAHAMERACPAYALADPYPGGAPQTADLRMAWNWVAEEFNCLSVLLEMPFKDTHRQPDPDMGWSPARCADLGRSTLEAIGAVAGSLR